MLGLWVKDWDVSIHAPARGATYRAGVASSSTLSFNPRSRTGSDDCCDRVRPPGHLFQSTLPHGERPMPWTKTGHCKRFNPRSRTGSDENCWMGRVTINGFNPRSRTGSDLTLYRRSPLALQFQSTLPHGERLSPYNITDDLLRFNPRSRTGSDVLGPRRERHWWSFNPRSRTGSDPSEFGSSPVSRMFQSTLPHGERLRNFDLTNTI